MTSLPTPEQLASHQKWLSGDAAGQRLILRDADLRDADLRDADLSGADLRRADLRRADLRDADLRDADLSGADLRDADLRGAYLEDAVGLPVAADASERLQAVARAALKPNALKMTAWHSCETTHCMAGWAVHLAGEPGRLLESALGTEVAGLYLLGAEAHSHFFEGDEQAREFLQGVLAIQQ